jgi:hypothetical protein
MPKYFGRALVLSLGIVACRSDTTDSDPLAQDTAFAREIGMAMADSLEEPVMTDLVGPSEVSTSGGGAPQPPGQGQSVDTIRSEASSAERPIGEVQSASPTVSASSGSSDSRIAEVTRTSDDRVSSSGGTLPRSSGPPPDSSLGDQPSRVAASTDTLNATRPIPAARTPSRRSSSLAIPAGTALALSSDAIICTNTHKVGQRFAAALTRSVEASDGSTVAAGARAVLEITQLKRSEESGDPIRMGFRVTSLASAGRVFPVNAPAHSAAIARVRSKSGTSDAQKVAAGAALGAAVGKAVGNDSKSAATGAVAGAVVGAAAAEASANYEGCVPAGGRINATVAD